MTAAGRAIGKAEHDVNVQAGLAVIAGGYVADRAEDFALFVDLDLPVVLCDDVEPADRRLFEGADRCQRGCKNPGFGCERVSAANASSPVSRMTT